MENFTPLSAAAGGALIGISVTLLLLFNGRIAGVSGIMNGVFFAPKNDRLWRLIFLFGLILEPLSFNCLCPFLMFPAKIIRCYYLCQAVFWSVSAPAWRTAVLVDMAFAALPIYRFVLFSLH